MLSIAQIYGIIAIGVSMVFGGVCIYNCFRFMAKRSDRFIDIRKPKLILLYAMCGAIPSLLIISPCKVYIDVLDASRTESTSVFIWWLLTLIQEFFISCMSIVIALRCWLLYYDHSYEISLVDKNWRGVINPNDTDFWLKNRKTWGDTGFLTGFGFLIANCVLITLSIISIYSLESKSVLSINATILVLVAIPCYIFIFSLVVYGKQTNLFIVSSDKFMIIKEMQYLSLSTLLMIIIYIIQLCNIKQLELVIETGQILFAFITCWIQNSWVIAQFHKYKRELREQEFRELHPQPSQNVESQQEVQTKIVLEMIDVLRNRYGFGMFMRHCQSELNVEGLLFIVEVAQYKAKLMVDEQLLTLSGTPSSTDPSLTPSTTSSDDEEKSDYWKPPKREEPILPSLAQTKNELNFQGQQEIIERFQGNILGRDWLPIANQLIEPKKKKGKRRKQRKGQKKRTADIQKIEVTKTDIKDLVIDIAAEYDENGDPIEDDIKEDIDKIDIKWMYDYAQYLFVKYIDVDSEFSINISGLVKQDLLVFFSKDMEKGFEFILNKHGYSIDILNELQDENLQKQREYLGYIKDFLYKLYDATTNEVWDLLEGDVFLRFMHTPQYKYLLDKYQKAQLQIV